MSPPKASNAIIKGLEWKWSGWNFKQWTQKNNDKNDTEIKYKHLNELKKDTHKQLTEIKENSNKQLDEIRKTMQNLKEESSKHKEIVKKKKSQIEILEKVNKHK
jgi:hypothetical protein